MSMQPLRTDLSGLALELVPLTTGAAHEIVGNRFFPATLTIDDPGVNHELALPTVDSFKTGDEPPVRQRDVSSEFSKRFTEDFAVSFGTTYTFLSPTEPTAAGANGFQNLDTPFKYRLFKNPEHEFVMSAGVSVEWGGSGDASVGAGVFNTYIPNIYFGKGFGDLRDLPDTLSLIRPVALTGQIGYAIPQRSFNTRVGVDPDSGLQAINTTQIRNWGFSLQYSMPYLKSAVVDLGLPDIINRLIPLVEANLQTPVSNTLTSGTMTSGTINPGLIWVGNTFQLGIEALIPINHQSGTNVGVIAQLHLFLDDIDPRGIGKPLFGGPVQPATPLRN